MAIRTTQTPVEVLGFGDVDARITQIPVEVLGEQSPDVRLTQVPIEVLGENNPPDVRLTQVPIEVLGIPSPNARITQFYIEVLGKIDGCALTNITMPATNPIQLDLTVTFNVAVNVTGTPCIDVQLATGVVSACFTGGSGTTTLTFVYVLNGTDSDQDGTIEFISPIKLNGGSITCAGDGQPSDLNFSNQSAAATADPHLIGFNGEKFDFHGEPNKFYNLVSDDNLQLNSYFRNWKTSENNNFTVMDKMGLSFDKYRIKIVGDFSVRINDKKVKRFPIFIPECRISKLKELPKKYIHLDNHPEFGQFLGGYLVLKYPYLFYFLICTDNVNSPYINLIAVSNDKMVRPHGVIGQTMEPKKRISTGDQGEGIIEGVYANYEVSDLWSSDFKFNKFKK